MREGRLQTEEQFGDIVVKTGSRGEVTRLRDVARVELGASEYGLRSLLDNKQAVAIPIFQAPGSNALADLGRRPRDDGRDQEEHAGRRGLPDRLRPDPVRTLVDRSGDPHAA